MWLAFIWSSGLLLWLWMALLRGGGLRLCSRSSLAFTSLHLCSSPSLSFSCCGHWSLTTLPLLHRLSRFAFFDWQGCFLDDRFGGRLLGSSPFGFSSYNGSCSVTPSCGATGGRCRGGGCCGSRWCCRGRGWFPAPFLGGGLCWGRKFLFWFPLSAGAGPGHQCRRHDLQGETTPTGSFSIKTVTTGLKSQSVLSASTWQMEWRTLITINV